AEPWLRAPPLLWLPAREWPLRSEWAAAALQPGAEAESRAPASAWGPVSRQSPCPSEYAHPRLSHRWAGWAPAPDGGSATSRRQAARPGCHAAARTSRWTASGRVRIRTASDG